MDSEKWKTDMEEEMDSLDKNNNWDLVDLSEGRSVVGCKWVFKLKRKVDGSIKRFMENPGEEHWRAVKWVLRYLRGTSDHCIIFNGSEGSVCRYVDVDYAGDLDKRSSTIGYFFTLLGGAIRVMSKLQERVVLSTTEAEYIAASDASKEAIWLKGLLDEIGRTQEKANVLSDSQSAIHLSTNPTYDSKTKHIDVRYHFLRHVIDGRKVALKKVHTRENCADIFTNPVTVEKL
eukprot:PITA_25652